MNYENVENRQETGMQEMGWNSILSSDEREYLLLPEGDYNFTVTGYERKRHSGSEKLPPCDKAAVSAVIRTAEGDAELRFDMFIHRKMEWRLSAFFRCIGQKKPGEEVEMDWAKVPGARGRAHIAPRTYISKLDGQPRTVNSVMRFLDYDPAFFEGEVPEGYAELDVDELPW